MSDHELPPGVVEVQPELALSCEAKLNVRPDGPFSPEELELFARLRRERPAVFERLRRRSDALDDAIAAYDRERRIPWTVPRMVYRDGADIPRREFLYGHAYARGFVTANIGDGGVGKSIHLIAELLAMASGKNLLGIVPRERVRVSYWNGDDPYVELERRVHAVCEHYGIDLATLIDEGWLYLAARDAHPLCVASAARFGPDINQDAANDIEAFIRAHNIGVAAFDPLKSLHRVPENSNTDMDVIGDVFNVIAERTHAAIALAHHIRKPAFGQNEATIADARGATALINKVRLSRVFNVMTQQLAIAAHIQEEDRRRYFRVDSGKANIAPPGQATWFKIIPVACQNGEDTPTVVAWKYPNAFDQVTPDHVNRIRTIAATGKYRKDSRAEDWIGKPVAEMLHLDLDDEADRKQVSKILKTWFANRVLTTKEGQDDNRVKRDFVVPGNWADAEQAAPTPERDVLHSDGGGIAFMLTRKVKVQLREQRGLTDKQIFNLTPQQAIDILNNGRTVTKWGVTFTVLGPADPDATCLYCKSAEPDTTGGVVNTNHGTLHEECAAAWISNQDKAR